MADPWLTRWNHPRTKETYTLEFKSPSAMDPDDLMACYSLVEETSRPLYEASPDGWQTDEKQAEMRSPEMRYVLVRDGNRSVRAFTSMMPTYEEGQPVLYCYEIHLKPELRGYVT